jgi:hypothetical protein
MKERFKRFSWEGRNIEDDTKNSGRSREFMNSGFHLALVFEQVVFCDQVGKSRIKGDFIPSLAATAKLWGEFAGQARRKGDPWLDKTNRVSHAILLLGTTIRPMKHSLSLDPIWVVLWAGTSLGCS